MLQRQCAWRTHHVRDSDDDVGVAGGEVPDGEVPAVRHNHLEQAARAPPRVLHGPLQFLGRAPNRQANRGNQK
jgi:hypothetical protein